MVGASLSIHLHMGECDMGRLVLSPPAPDKVQLLSCLLHTPPSSSSIDTPSRTFCRHIHSQCRSCSASTYPMGNIPLSYPHDHRSVVLLGSKEVPSIRTSGFLFFHQMLRCKMSGLHPYWDSARMVPLNKNDGINNHSWAQPDLICQLYSYLLKQWQRRRHC